MNKKALLILLISLAMFAIIGCSNEMENNEGDIGSSENNIEVLEVDVEDLKVKLDSSRSFNKISFKIPSSSQTMNVGTYFLADYMNGYDFVFRTAIYCFENKNIEESMEGKEDIKVGTIEVNGREWHVYKDKTQNNENMLNYAYQYGNDTYTITFIYVKNIDRYIDAFLNEVEFK